MAFAIVSSKIYPVDANTPLRNQFEQVIELNMTALASDGALALATVASNDATYGPYITKVLSGVDKIMDYFIFESPRAVTNSGATHILSGTSAAPVFTFTGTASTPLTLTMFLRFKLKADVAPICYNIT